MKILLDTHVLIWALQNNPKLPYDIIELIVDPHNDVYVSATSIWEIAIKNQKLPHEMPYSAKDIVNYATIAGYYFLSMNIDHAVMYNEIAYKEGMKVNRDPFDKMLVTQAKTNGMRLLTHVSLMGCFAEDCIINF